MYNITCACNFSLEVEDGDTVKCPDCGRVYDDRGVLIGREEVEEPTIFRVKAEYYVKAKSLEQVEQFVGEECGLDFYERHILIDEINEDDMLNQDVDEDLTERE